MITENADTCSLENKNQRSLARRQTMDDYVHPRKKIESHSIQFNFNSICFTHAFYMYLVQFDIY